MKAFEEWWNKGKINDDYYYAHKRAWRAALEWIYYQVCPEAWDVGDVEFDIEQELKDEKETI